MNPFPPDVAPSPEVVAPRLQAIHARLRSRQRRRRQAFTGVAAVAAVVGGLAVASAQAPEREQQVAAVDDRQTDPESTEPTQEAGGELVSACGDLPRSATELGIDIDLTVPDVVPAPPVTTMGSGHSVVLDPSSATIMNTTTSDIVFSSGIGPVLNVVLVDGDRPLTRIEAAMAMDQSHNLAPGEARTMAADLHLTPCEDPGSPLPPGTYEAVALLDVRPALPPDGPGTLVTGPRVSVTIG